MIGRRAESQRGSSSSWSEMDADPERGRGLHANVGRGVNLASYSPERSGGGAIPVVSWAPSESGSQLEGEMRILFSEMNGENELKYWKKGERVLSFFWEGGCIWICGGLFSLWRNIMKTIVNDNNVQHRFLYRLTNLPSEHSSEILIIIIYLLVALGVRRGFHMWKRGKTIC